MSREEGWKQGLRADRGDNLKKIFDISMDVFPEMVTYPGDPPVEFVEMHSIDKGDLYNLWVMSFGSHTGTHIDAPRHFIRDGKTVDELSPECFAGRAKVIEIRDTRCITADELKGHEIEEGNRILFKTANSQRSDKMFIKDFVYLSPAAAEYLVQKKVMLVGLDALSIENPNGERPDAHYALLGNDIVVLEGLVLRDVPPGGYEFYALPLKIRGGNGSPVRAVLISQ